MKWRPCPESTEYLDPVHVATGPRHPASSLLCRLVKLSTALPPPELVMATDTSEGCLAHLKRIHTGLKVYVLHCSLVSAVMLSGLESRLSGSRSHFKDCR